MAALTGQDALVLNQFIEQRLEPLAEALKGIYILSERASTIFAAAADDLANAGYSQDVIDSINAMLTGDTLTTPQIKSGLNTLINTTYANANADLLTLHQDNVPLTRLGKRTMPAGDQ